MTLDLVSPSRPSHHGYVVIQSLCICMKKMTIGANYRTYEHRNG